MSTKQRELDYEHWSSDWLDVTELQAGFEVVFAAEHRESELFVSLVPQAAADRGPMTADTELGVEYRRIVRPRQGARALSEHTVTYSSACKAEALEQTHQWLLEHSDGLEYEVEEA